MLDMLVQQRVASKSVSVTPHSCERVPALRVSTGALRGSRWQCYVMAPAGNWAGRQRSVPWADRLIVLALGV